MAKKKSTRVRSPVRRASVPKKPRGAAKAPRITLVDCKDALDLARSQEQERERRLARMDAIRAACDEVYDSPFLVKFEPETTVRNCRQVLEFLSNVAPEESFVTCRAVENGRGLILQGLTDALQHVEDYYAAAWNYDHKEQQS